MDDFSNHILDDYHDMNNAAFDDEVDFIDETIAGLSDRTINSAAGSVTTATYSVHQSPMFDFPYRPATRERGNSRICSTLSIRQSPLATTKPGQCAHRRNSANNLPRGMSTCINTISFAGFPRHCRASADGRITSADG